MAQAVARADFDVGLRTGFAKMTVGKARPDQFLGEN